jgi:hypothetical protein
VPEPEYNVLPDANVGEVLTYTSCVMVPLATVLVQLKLGAVEIPVAPVAGFGLIGTVGTTAAVVNDQTALHPLLFPFA